MEIKITFGTLSDDLIQKIKQYPSVAEKFITNLTAWEPDLVGSSGVIFVYHLQDELLEQTKYELINKFPELEGSKFSIAYTLGSRLSYVQWHCDQHHKYALTVYLNEHWDRKLAFDRVKVMAESSPRLSPRLDQKLFFHL